MGISMNGPSGIDTQSLIDSLVQLEQDKITTVSSQKTKLQSKIDAYTQMGTYITAISTGAATVDKAEDFNLYKLSTTNDTALSVTTTTSAAPGSFDVDIFQIAQREKLISASGKVVDQAASLQSTGITPGTISINGVSIDISATDTIQDLRAKINSTKDASGNTTGVTASVLKSSDNNYRLVLSANDTGSKGATYLDVSGNVLQSLGIINAPSGDNKGVKYQSTLSDNAVFAATPQNSTINISAIDHTGKTVSISFNRIEGTAATPTTPAILASTAKDFTDSIEHAFNGTVKAEIDGTGNLKITDKTGGNSKLSITSFNTVTGSPATTTATTFTPTAGSTGSNVLSMGADAFFCR